MLLPEKCILKQIIFDHLHGNIFTFTFTFTFGEDSILSSAEAVISFSPICSPKVTERLYKSL